MRLKGKLQEAAEFQMVVKDIESKMYELYRVLKKNGFQMSDSSLEKSLDSIFSDKGIGFQPGPRRGARFSQVIHGAGVTDQLFVVVEYTPGFSEYFRRFARPEKRELFFDIARNEFFRSLAEVVSHEYKHIFQSMASRGKTSHKETNPQKMGYANYLKSPEELDAFALQAAIQQMRTGESTTIQHYYHYFSEEEPKVWQRFVKKVHKHLKDLKKRGMEKYIRLN